MLARLCGFLVWALVAASVVFWGLRLFVKSPQAPANALPVAESMAVRGDLTRLFGQAPPPPQQVAAAAPSLASRFRLFGVMAPKPSEVRAGAGGLALIAVDGKPAKPFPVGAAVDGDLVVQSVSLRTASLGPVRGGPAVLLELPPPTSPQTGSPASMVSAPPAPVFQPPPLPMPVQPPPVLPQAAPATPALEGTQPNPPVIGQPGVRRDRGPASQ
jgi:general secretion pathway protein C